MSDQMLVKAAAKSLRINPVEKDKKPDRNRDGTVRAVNPDGTYAVALDDAPDTPITCMPYCTAMVGDKVAVVLRSDGVYIANGRLGGDLGGGGTIITQHDDVSNYIAGRVFAYAGTDEPIGCLLCDGRAVSRTTYWELFDAIGTTYGAGDGSSTFNLPNIESRTIIGESDSYALGATGGEEKHALTVDEMPSHAHRLNIGSGTVSDYLGGSSASYGIQSDGDGSTLATTYTGSIVAAGGNAAHNNMQPYIVMRYFITTGKGDPVSGINPADYVVEWGQTDGWRWEKWASGKAECETFLVNYALDSAYDDLYYTSATVDLPFELASVKAVYATGQDENNLIDASVSDITTTSVRVYISSAVANITDACASVKVSGFWKTPSEAGGTETIAPTIEERFEDIESNIDLLKTNRVLWSSGGSYMDEGQTATLSEAISAQPHGIVLVWSCYNSDGTQDWNFSYNFVPKYHAAVFNGKGVEMGFKGSADFGGSGGVCSKYVYISDTQITGSSLNNDTGTGSGVTFDNRIRVLRYVIGV